MNNSAMNQATSAHDGAGNLAAVSKILNSILQETQQQPHQQQHDSPQHQNRTQPDTTTINNSSNSQLSPPPTVYGELCILGYNGSISHSDRGNKRIKSKFLLCQKPQPNGIKKSKHYIVKQPQATKAIQDKDLHSISYTFSRSQAIIVEYKPDEETDMFQIGRSSESPIDFVIIDTVQNGSNHSSAHSSHNHHSRSSHKSRHSENNFNHHISDMSHTSHNTDYIQVFHQTQPFPMVKVPDPYLRLSGQQDYRYSNNRDSVPILLDNPNQNCVDFSNSRLTQFNSIDPHMRSHPSSAIQYPNIDVPPPKSHSNQNPQSTISRFACRILVDRKPPYTARIYAAGFDSSRNIFLGEKATKWEQDNTIDGLTTNGVLLMHPKTGYFCENKTTNETNNNKSKETGGVWREVSVDGGIYAIRESRSAAQKGAKIEDETNVLQDGTLIDLCGATLLWRSLDGFKSSPTKKVLEEKIDLINASRPQCPVGLNTLIISRKPVLSSNKRNELYTMNDPNTRQPYIYLKCGHVQGHHNWGTIKASNQRKCPICFSVGPVSRLTVGIEPSFYMDSGDLSHVFSPCGHMASEKTIKYWSSVKIPHGTHFFHAICPFCALPLTVSDPSFTRLIFQDYVD